MHCYICISWTGVLRCLYPKRILGYNKRCFRSLRRVSGLRIAHKQRLARELEYKISGSQSPPKISLGAHVMILQAGVLGILMAAGECNRKVGCNGGDDDLLGQPCCHSSVLPRSHSDWSTCCGCLDNLEWGGWAGLQKDSKEPCETEPAVGLPLQYVQKKVKDWIHQDHNRHWSVDQGFKQSQVLISGPDHVWRGRCIVSCGGSRTRSNRVFCPGTPPCIDIFMSGDVWRTQDKDCEWIGEGNVPAPAVSLWHLGETEIWNLPRGFLHRMWWRGDSLFGISSPLLEGYDPPETAAEALGASRATWSTGGPSRDTIVFYFGFRWHSFYQGRLDQLSLG